jgi:hypothetical protein
MFATRPITEITRNYEAVLDASAILVISSFLTR